MMKRCAILTMDQTDDFAVYDQVLDAPMADLGWQTAHISWRDPSVDWNDYAAVIIRSPWDYQDDADGFMQVLENIERSSAVLLNDLNTVKWNINKHYLREVESKGATIVPTLWREHFEFEEVEGFFKHFNTDQIVIKPTISANADNTFWLKKDSYADRKAELQDSLQGRQLMIQPFIQSVVDEGEYSLFYFADEYSHSILKTPKSGDFRVQEEHGGQLQAITPCQELLTTASKALQTMPNRVLYARIDLVKHEDEFKVMEIELIEPSLYFPFCETSPEHFCKVFDTWMKSP